MSNTNISGTLGACAPYYVNRRSGDQPSLTVVMWQPSTAGSSGELPRLYNSFFHVFKSYDNDTLQKANVAASTFRVATEGVPSLRQLVLSRLGRGQSMTFLRERAKLRKCGMRNARLLFEPYNSVESSLVMQEIEIRITWEGETRGRKRRNGRVFYHFDREKRLLEDPSRPWGQIEVSYFAGCGSGSFHLFDLHANTFHFSLRTQEALTPATFHAVLDLMLGSTRAGKILRRRIGGTNLDRGAAFKVDTREILTGGRETRKHSAVYTYSSERRQYPEDFPEPAEWGKKGFLTYFLQSFYESRVSVVQEQFVKMVKFLDDPTQEGTDFLEHRYEYPLLGVWFDIKFEQLENIELLRLFLD